MATSRDAEARIIDVTTPDGSVAAPEWMLAAESVHRQLRPHMPSDYPSKMQAVFAGGGRMCVAVVDDEVAGVAVYRVFENTYCGIHMYVDDLITDERRRSTGVGKALLDHLQAIARRLECVKFTLDSGTHRQQAHKFYFREGMVVAAFHFVKTLS